MVAIKRNFIAIIIVLLFLSSCNSKIKSPTASLPSDLPVSPTQLSHTPTLEIVASTPSSPDEQTAVVRSTRISQSETREAIVRAQQTMTALIPTATRTLTPTPIPTETRAPTATLPFATLQVVQTVEAFRSTCEDLAQYVEFSPSRRWIIQDCFFSKDGKTFNSLMALELQTDRTHRVDYDISFGYVSISTVRWSEDERYYYYTLYPQLDGPGGLIFDGLMLGRMDLQTGQVTEILPMARGYLSLYSFTFSENGRWLAHSQHQNQETIYLTDLSTGTSKSVSLGPEWERAGKFVWSPDRKWVAFEAKRKEDEGEVKTILGVLSTETMTYRMILEDTELYLDRMYWENGELVIELDERKSITSDQIQKTYRYDPITGKLSQ